MRNYFDRGGITAQTIVAWSNGELSEEEVALVLKHFRSLPEDYEYDSSHIVTKSKARVRAALKKMCCGIYEHTLMGPEGPIYIAFDYGH